jgi:hypothetical protein
MATAMTARYLDQLKPQRTRFEVFDTLVPGPAIPSRSSGLAVPDSLLLSAPSSAAHFE